MIAKRPSKKELAQALLDCQVLFGRTLAEFHNDRNPMRADAVEPLLIRGEELCIEILGKFPQEYSARKGATQ